MRLARKGLTRALRPTISFSMIVSNKDSDSAMRKEYETLYSNSVEEMVQSNKNLWESAPKQRKQTISTVIMALQEMTQEEKNYLNFLILKNSILTEVNGGINSVGARVLKGEETYPNQIMKGNSNGMDQSEAPSTISGFLEASQSKSSSSVSPTDKPDNENETAQQEVEEIKEQTAFTLKLIEVPAAKKLVTIKEVKAVLGFGLKEAKVLVEEIPAELKSNITKEEAETIKLKFEGLGCVLEIV